MFSENSPTNLCGLVIDDDVPMEEEPLSSTAPTMWQPSQSSQRSTQEVPTQVPTQEVPTQVPTQESTQATQESATVVAPTAITANKIRFMVYHSFSKKCVEDLENKLQDKMVMTLSIGIKDDAGSLIADLSKNPYKTAKGKRNFTPTLQLLQREVKQCCELLEIQTEKDAKNMTVTECRAWLTEHPRTALGCVYYLIEHEKKLYESLLPKPKKSAGGSGGGDDGGSDDQGSGRQIFDLPTWLHLIHCAMDDQA
jgi:hypothetical protein